MKVKRFNNLWAMGLILFGAILIAFYIAKIFFPEFIVGVAEIPAIVKFGEYVDSHKWAYYLYYTVIGYVGWFLICCICCNTKSLRLKANIIIILNLVLSLFIQNYMQQFYTPYNYTANVLVPFLVCIVSHKTSTKNFISLCVCFCVDIMAQAISLYIRDIVVLSTAINSATITIMLIDTWIWRILLYLFFNYKGE